MTIDRLHIGIYNVAVVPISANAQQKVAARIELLEREIQHLQRALTNIKFAMRHTSSQTHAPLANAVMDSRNWMLSVVMSQAYIQYMFTPPTGPVGNAFPYYSGQLTQRAVEAGAHDADRDRSN